MAKTSLWRIKGILKQVLQYASNEEKTTVEINGRDMDSLDDVLSYAARDDATNQRQLVDGINCSPDNVLELMNQTKVKYRKTGGMLAFHGYQSFKEGEVTPDLAHEIGIELAEKLWGDRYEVLVCTHVDKSSHIHNHFVINTVSFLDGKKFFRSVEDYRKMQQMSDQLCREHGLSVIRHPQGKGKDYSEWSAEQNGKPTYRSMVRRDIDDAVKSFLTEREFWSYLEEKGYELKLYGKNGKELERPSLKPPGASRFLRFDGLGVDYLLDEIRERILENIKRRDPLPEADLNAIRTYRKEHPPRTKLKGLAALYYHYCYELHIIVRYPASAKQVSFFMREDIRKLDRLDEQTRFLGKNKIESLDDLHSFQTKTQDSIRLLEWERQVQRNLLKQEVRKDDQPGQLEVKEKNAGISDQIKKFRKELQICDSVEQRSGQMQKELAKVVSDHNKEQVSIAMCKKENKLLYSVELSTACLKCVKMI